MIRASIIILFVLELTPLGAPAATCAGPNPAITSVAVKNVTSNASTNEYHLVGTVTNLGSQAESSNTLQFVDVYVDRMKRTDRGIPPLRPGQSYQFGYTWTRSVDAGTGTTTAHFRIRMVQGSNCNPANGTTNVTF